MKIEVSYLVGMLKKVEKDCMEKDDRGYYKIDRDQIYGRIVGIIDTLEMLLESERQGDPLIYTGSGFESGLTFCGAE